MRRVPSDSETTSRCNGNTIHSILKETHRIPSISESSRNRHLSNESCSSIKGVTFDKSLPTNAFRSERTTEVSTQSLRNRRTSLPVNTSLQPRLRDQGNISEARGLIMDMLQNRDLQPQVISCLRAVASLLTPQMSVQNGNFMDFLPKVVENPYSGEQLTVSPASKPRVSNITFSTVTSATGLPTIAAEPSRPRSSNHWKPIHQDGPLETPQPSTAAPPPTCQRQHHSSQSCSCLSQQACQVHKPKEKSLYRRRYSSATEERSLKVLADGRDEADAATSEDTAAEKERRRSAGSNIHPSPILINSSSTFSAHSLSTSPFAKSPSVVAKSPSPSVAFSLHEEPEDGEPQTPPESTTKTKEVLPVDTWTAGDGVVYSKRELDRDKALHRIDEWSFPVFDFAEAYKTTVLSRITYAVFKQADLFNIFKISPQKFFNFFHSLEMGYWEIPYHNRIHAADVLHGCHYLTCHPVNAFRPTPTTPDDEITEGMEDLNIESLFDSSSISIASTMNGLELMALYTAAAMHDFDHPGRTNAFLVAAEDKKAILYNDRSVLENHHAAESWKLLSQVENNFIDVLDVAETKRFRYLVLEYILATDLKQHFDIIMSFNDKAADMDLSNEADRVLVSQMLIKFADINSPAKPYTLHRQWTDRICQEFYEQGDEEKVRSMPVSPYMDRNEPAVAKLQDSFIAHIVNPLVIALNEAGLLPSMPGLEDPEVIINLKHNHQKWLAEIEEHNQSEEEIKEDQDQTDNQDFGSASTTTATAFESDKIIYTMKQVEKTEAPVMNGTCEKGDHEILGRFEKTLNGTRKYLSAMLRLLPQTKQAEDTDGVRPVRT